MPARSSVNRLRRKCPIHPFGSAEQPELLARGSHWQGEGWMPLLMGARLAQATRSASIGTPEELAVAVRDLKDLVYGQGRDPETIQVQVYSSHSTIGGGDFSATEHLDYLGRLAAAGANWFVVRPVSASVTDCCDSMAAYDDEVISNMR